MRRFLILVGAWLAAVPASAQDCTPVPHRYLAWGAPGERIVWGETVPLGQVWELESGGAATTDNRVLEYMAQHFVPPGWFVPHATSGYHSNSPTSVTGSTPVIAFQRGTILSAGEALGVRVNSTPDFATMAVLYKVFVYPEACLARLKGVAALVSAGAPSPPDFTALLQAAQIAATALTGLAASVP